MRQLRYFVAIAEEGSLSAAAARLLMTQPPLSAVVAGLEKEIGAQLLVRHPRGVLPTAAGRELLAWARRLERELGEATASVRALADGATGTLRLTSVPSAADRCTPAFLRRYVQRWPDVHLDVTESAGPVAALEAVRQRSAEAAVLFTSDPVELRDRYAAGLEVRLIGPEPLVLMAPNGAAPVDQPGVADLGAALWLLTGTPASFPGLARVLEQEWRRAGVDPPRRTVASLGIARLFLRAGIGVTAMNESAAAGLGDDVVLSPMPEGCAELHAVVVAIPEQRTVRNLLELATPVP
ncbi:LysR family transcriptional regulator [Klenkia sp. PcliD-1-E]|uniref:LysR family transcriptional regulator n=1 Tax=Klenkia sp. PcliD-1-E TaxID=2954492 RepID=UPI0020969C38|nr:LysR family transcriptional regulator [Klenkia sp. PcliD-1-E]MCO7221121.1 LysR family transcriptional regulator [Klenkia sp. PcliD-1-E]